MSKIRIMIADDHPLYLEALGTKVGQLPEVEVLAMELNGKKLLEKIERRRPDIVITDVKMPVMDGIELTRIIKKRWPQIKVLALTAYNLEQTVQHMLAAGAEGYILKVTDKEEIANAIQSLYQGKKYYCQDVGIRMIGLMESKNFMKASAGYLFNTKELAIINYICQEKSTQEISEVLNMSFRSVEKYRERIFEKAGVHKTAGLVKYAIRNGYYSEEYWNEEE